MKYSICFLVSLFLITACKEKEVKNSDNYSINNNEKTEIINDENIQADAKNIIGTWNWRSGDKSQEFTIKIKKIDNDSVFGQYCAVYNNGNKLDCDFDDINNIKGLIIGDKIQLNFNSFFGAKNGKAEIKISEKYIEWKVTKSPKGEYYAPESATLYRKDDNNKSQLNDATNDVDQSEGNLLYNKKIDVNNVKYQTSFPNKIEGIEKFSCDDKKIRYVQLPNKKDVNLILVPQDCGDFNYIFYLLTILNGKVISKEYVEGEWYEPGDDTYKEITSFTIDKNHLITVTTNSIENNKTSLKQRVKFQIMDNGALKKI